MSVHVIPLAAGALVLAAVAALPKTAHPEGDRQAAACQFAPLPQAFRPETPARLTPPGGKAPYDPCARLGPAVGRRR